MDRSSVLDVVYASVDEVNTQLGSAVRLEKSPDTILYGDAGPLDSLTLLNLLVAVEERLEERDITVSLVDEDALAQAEGPFQTIQTFVDYVHSRL